MDAQVEAVLDRLHERMERERAEQAEISREAFRARLDEWMLPVGEEAGRLLNMLVKLAGARIVVEVGTSVGYSTVWLAEAVRATGGRVFTIDANPDKHAQARGHLEAAGLLERVDFITRDAVEALRALPGPLDFVLLDVWKDAYLPCFEEVAPKLAPGGVVAADNILHPASENTKAYQAHVQRLAGYDSVLVPVGNGIELTRKRA